MPAQSPTLSPTLSAIVAGLRGSSSGMPASTLPTRSPPTSAPLVKMPPPRRAKIEISVDHDAVVGLEPEEVGEIGEIEGDAEQRQTGHQHAGDRTRLEGEFKSAGQRSGRRLRGAHIGANRDVHADEARGTRQDRADQEADRDQHAEEVGQQREDHDADHGDRHVLALQIGLRTFAHGGGDFLHPRIAGVCLHHRCRRPDGVNDRKRSAEHNHP